MNFWKRSVSEIESDTDQTLIEQRQKLKNGLAKNRKKLPNIGFAKASKPRPHAQRG
jgi:hypothetical protein